MSRIMQPSEQSMETRLGTAGQKIDALVAKARHARDHGKARASRRVDLLRARQARTRTRLRELREAGQAAWQASVVELHLELDELEVELAIAEARVDAELAADDAAFAAAVEAELDAWNTRLEVLQAAAATTSHHARERREVAIRRVRERRAAAKRALRALRNGSSASGPAGRTEVTRAIDDLDWAAEEAAAKFD